MNCKNLFLLPFIGILGCGGGLSSPETVEPVETVLDPAPLSETEAAPGSKNNEEPEGEASIPPSTPGAESVDAATCKTPPVFEGPIAFARGKIKLNQEARTTLDRFARVILDDALVEKIEVTGHTASSEGKPAKRSRLAQQRAASATAYLVERGVDHKAITTVSHGDSCPAILTNNKKLDAPNRRVEIQVTKYCGKDLSKSGQCGEDLARKSE